MVRRSVSTGKTVGGRQRTIVPRRRATLPQADQELHAVLDTIDYGILFMGPDLRAKLINRAFRKMWDISDEFIRETRPTLRDLVTHVWAKISMTPQRISSSNMSRSVLRRCARVQLPLRKCGSGMAGSSSFRRDRCRTAAVC